MLFFVSFVWCNGEGNVICSNTLLNVINITQQKAINNNLINQNKRQQIIT